MQFVLLGPRLLLAARHVQVVVEQLPAKVFNRSASGRNPPGIDVDQVRPALCQFGPGRYLDHRRHRQTIRRAAPGGEHMQVHPRRQLQRPADKITGRGRAEDQPFALEALARAEHAIDRTATGFDDRAQGLFDNVRQPALLVARRGVGAAVRLTLGQVTVVPVHFPHQFLSNLLSFRAGGQQINRVAHLGNFGKHHRRASAQQQIRGITQRRVGGDAGKRIAAAALHAQDQLGRRHSFPATLIELLQTGLGQRHDLLDHLSETVTRILQAVQPRLAQIHRAVALVHHLPGLQFLAAQADDQGFATQVRVARQIAYGADRDVRVSGSDRHPAAVAVGERHHVIDVRVLGQQFILDALDRMVEHAGHALDGRRNPENIARANGTVGVAIPLEGVTVQRCLGRRYFGGQRQAVQRWRGGHAQLIFLDPAAARDRLQRIANGLAVTNHLAAFGNVLEGDFMALRHEVHRHQAIWKLGTGRYALVVDHDHDVVPLVQADVARRVGMFNQLHDAAPQECA